MSNNEQNYSPFWAILLLLVALTSFESFQVYGLYNQVSNSSQIMKNSAQLLSASAGARGKLEALAQDLYALSQKGDPGATQLVNKLNIHPTSPAGTNAAPANPTH